MRTSSFFALVLSVTLFVAVQHPGRSHAGPVEQLVQLAVHPSDPDLMAIRYVNGGDGLLYSDDAGATFKLLCLSAVDVAVRRSGTVAFGGDGHLVMGVFGGAYEDAGGGCGWSPVPSLAGIWVSDLAADPIEPGVLYLATSKSDAGGPLPNGLVRRGADGTYEPFGVQEALLVTRVRVVATESGRRFYQSAIMGMIPGTINGMMVDVPNYVIRVSDDDAETFETFPFGDTGGGAFRLVAVDPTNPDRIVALRDREGEPDDLLVSSDRGETFTDYLPLTNFGAIALASDGRVFIGESGLSTDPSASTGLWSAANLDTAPQKLAEYPVQCLDYQEASDTLFVCQRWSFGTADTEDGTFTETMKFTTVPDFVTCDGIDMPATCEAQMCGDYCGPGHFAQAPLCEAYDQPYCGPCVAAMETEGAEECTSGGASGAGAVDAGAGEAGSGPAAGAGSGAGGRAGGGEGGNGAAGNGAAGGGNDGGDDGGCSISASGPAHAHTGNWLAALASVAWIARKRRRARG
jgi:MYXO-CTERM domain-containing protein